MPGTAWIEHPWEFEAHLGAGTPVGGIGVTADYSVVPALALGAGIGIGSGLDGETPHAAAIMRVRPFYGVRNAFVTNLSYSVGGYKELSLDLGMGHSSTDRVAGADVAHWAQVDFGWERHAASGFLFRVTGGFATMLNPGDLQCTEVDRFEGTSTSCSAYRSDVTIPTFDLALGYAF